MAGGCANCVLLYHIQSVLITIIQCFFHSDTTAVILCDRNEQRKREGRDAQDMVCGCWFVGVLSAHLGKWKSRAL